MPDSPILLRLALAPRARLGPGRAALADTRAIAALGAEAAAPGLARPQARLPERQG
jgi:hypothetical protein